MNLQAAYLEYLADCKARQLKPASIRFYRTHVGALVRFLLARGVDDVLGLDRRALRAFYVSLADRDLAQATLAAYDRAVRAFVRFCLDERELEVDPLNGRRRVRSGRPLPDTWTLDEVAALLATCAPDPVGLRDRALMCLLLDTGLRAGEVVALALDDLTLNGQRGRCVVRAEGSKSDQDRTVYLYADTVNALRAWLDVRPAEARTVFVALDGRASLSTRPLTPNGLNQLIRRRVVLAGVPMKHKLCHIWRHTFAKLYVRAGGDLETLRRLLGHMSLETTRVYLGFRDREVAERHWALSPVRQLAMTR